MPIQLEIVDETATLLLTDSIDISVAAELKSALLQAFGSCKEIHLDLSGVSALDVTGAQLLWAAEQQARRAQARFCTSRGLIETIANQLCDAGFSCFASDESKSTLEAV